MDKSREQIAGLASGPAAVTVAGRANINRMELGQLLDSLAAGRDHQAAITSRTEPAP